MIKVRALSTYKDKNIKDKELNRIPNSGEEFEIDERRLDVLLGNNGFNIPFVEVVNNEPEGNEPEDNESEGNEPEDNEPEGNEPDGNEPEGNESEDKDKEIETADVKHKPKTNKK